MSEQKTNRIFPLKIEINTIQIFSNIFCIKFLESSI